MHLDIAKTHPPTQKASRTVLGKGFEHTVLEPRRESANYVLKVPRGINALIARWRPEQKTQILRSELQTISKMAESNGFTVPETRILRLRDGYVIVQEKIPEDGSVDTSKFIDSLPQDAQQNLDLNPANFHSNEGKVYVIDTFRGFFSRWSEKIFPKSFHKGISKLMWQYYHKFYKAKH